MAVARAQPQLRARAAREQAVRVRGRDDPVLAALDEQDRRLDSARASKPQGARERDVVVDQPVGPGPGAAARRRPERRPGPGERRPVGRGEAVGVELLRSRRTAARASRPSAAARSAPGSTIPANQSKSSVERRDPGERRRPPVTRSGEQGRAGQRVRAAAGRAHDREPLRPRARRRARATSAAADADVAARVRGVDPP